MTETPLVSRPEQSVDEASLNGNQQIFGDRMIETFKFLKVNIVIILPNISQYLRLIVN